MKRASSNTPHTCVDAVWLASMLCGLLSAVNSGFECHCLLSFQFFHSVFVFLPSCARNIMEQIMNSSLKYKAIFIL